MEFVADKEFGKRLKTLAPYFLSMLVEIAMETKGNVSHKCEKVLSASKKYRQSQDYLSLFFEEKLQKAKRMIKLVKMLLNENLLRV